MKCSECNVVKRVREFVSVDAISTKNMIQTCLNCLTNSPDSRHSEHSILHGLCKTKSQTLTEIQESHRVRKEEEEKERELVLAGSKTTGRVIVTDLESKCHSISITTSTTLEEFKRLVQISFGVPPDKQLLMYKSFNIEDRLDEKTRFRSSEDEISWKDLKLPLDGEIQLAVRMLSSGLNMSMISSECLQFNLCWDRNPYFVRELAYLQHLNAVCIAVTTSGAKIHVDFKTMMSPQGVQHNGRSRKRMGSSSLTVQMYQTIEVTLADVEPNIMSLYFILNSVADMSRFKNKSVELTSLGVVSNGKVLDTYTKTGVTGSNCAIIMCCAKRSKRSGVGWSIFRLGEVCTGCTSRSREDYSDMDATVERLEMKFKV